jgi:ankyrin repeat protein
LKNGANPNQEDYMGITPLHLSAYKGQDDNVEILIKHKADPNKKDKMESKKI